MIKTPSSTVIGGAFWTPNCTSVGGDKAFGDADIQKLFAGGERGFWFDASDLSVAYQDIFGTVAQTQNTATALFLDKSKAKALGFEQIKNGTFDTSDSWEPSSSIINGSARIYSPNGAFDGIRQVSPLNTLKTYKVEFDIVQITGGGYIALHAGSAGVSRYDITSAGHHNILLQPVSTPLYISIARATVCDFTVDNISIREILGYHCKQITASKRPTLTVDGVIFDKVDDQLDIAFDSALSNCTIVRTTKSGGTVVQTGQSVAQNYAITQDFHQLMIINRALTASELSKVTAYFNKKAGYV
jgi:hypothetical protein